ARTQIAARAQRRGPAGTRWLHHRVVGRVTVTAPAEVRCAIPLAGGVRLMLSDGSERTVDHLLPGTGFRAPVERIRFPAPPIRDGLRHRHGFPALDGQFESSVPRLCTSWAGWPTAATGRSAASCQARARQLAASSPPPATPRSEVGKGPPPPTPRNLRF